MSIVEIDIRRYTGHRKTYCMHLLGMKRDLALFKVEKDTWLAANEQLSFGCDVEFTGKIAAALAAKVRKFKPEVLLTAEAKSSALVYEMAKHLGHSRYAIARKLLKEDIPGYLKVKAASITSRSHSSLILSANLRKLIKGKRLILVDDVISTGATMQALMRLAKIAGAEVRALASIWLEGPWPPVKFKKYLDSGRLVYLGVLPVFARGAAYKKLVEKSLKQ